MTNPAMDNAQVTQKDLHDAIYGDHGWRRKEVQAIGAAISTRNWHSLEMAYNNLRDKMDARHRNTRANADARLVEALTPSGDTKAAYMGEFSFSLRRVDDYGDEYNEKVYVPWDTIKEIMKAIRDRAALSEVSQ